MKKSNFFIGFLFFSIRMQFITAALINVVYEYQMKMKRKSAFTMIHCLHEISPGFISHFLNVSDIYCVLYVLPGVHNIKREIYTFIMSKSQRISMSKEFISFN